MLSERGADLRRSILASVKRPSRYTGGEWGSGPVKSSDSDVVRVCYAFPDVYEVGMSYLGYQILYGLTKTLPFAECLYKPYHQCRVLLHLSDGENVDKIYKRLDSPWCALLIQV